MGYQCQSLPWLQDFIMNLVNYIFELQFTFYAVNFTFTVVSSGNFTVVARFHNEHAILKCKCEIETLVFIIYEFKTLVLMFQSKT